MNGTSHLARWCLFSIDNILIGHGLRERDINGFAPAQSHIKLAVYLHRTGFDTICTTSAFVLIYITRLLFDLDLKITHKALYLLYFGITKESYIRVLSHINHFGSENASRAIQGGEGLVQLSHAPTDGGFTLY